MDTNPPKTISAVEKSLDIVNALRELDGAGVTELSSHLNMSKSTVHVHLRTLEEHSYVVAESGAYKLGLRFLEFGDHVRQSQPLYEIANTVIENIAVETGERAYCMVEQNGLTTTILFSEGSGSIRTDSRTETHAYMHCTSAGKAILAHLEKNRVEEVIDRWGLEKITNNTITNRTDLYEALRRGRKRGFFVSREEYQVGVTSIGAPIYDRETDTIYGAVSISGPAIRLQGDLSETDLSRKLLTAANTIEVNMKNR